MCVTLKSERQIYSYTMFFRLISNVEILTSVLSLSCITHTELASVMHYFVSACVCEVCFHVTCSVCSALWKSRRNDTRLNLYMLLILDRSVITKYILLAVSASGRYASLSYRHMDTD